ncbi:Signal transduction histidine kinase [Ekhidna lutea]|uniref:histidine kinase n=1 Tax=Ekhidna lutea TaxID=447679 RepID=A0A239K507_EKHLU|nr:sensor histidine kinase [Ekhidna lutea]SNT13235.1 Signal transduction histidine kinase [Ekhidna lutea]
MQQQIELMEIGSIAIFAAYNLVLFWQVKKTYYLYLALLCVVIFVRATLVDDGSMIFYTFFPDVSLTLGRKIEFFCSYAGVPLTLLFIYRLYTLPHFVKFVKGFLIVTFAFLLFVLVTPYRIFYHTLDIYNLIILLSYVLTFSMLISAVRKELTGSIYVLSGTALCFVFVMAELLKTSGIIFINAGPNLVNTGFIVFLFFQSIALSEIFAKSFRENKELNKDLEKRVEEKISELKRSSLLRDTLIRIVSHDLRGPLGNLKSVITLTRDEQVSVEQAKEFLGTIDKGVDHTIQMLDELMEWGHAASDNKRIDQEEIVLKEMIDPIVEQARNHIDNKELKLKISGDLEAVCLFDKNALKVVLRNLLSNAVKFTEKNGNIDLMVEERSDTIHVQFCDTGIGIPDEMKTNLFEMKKDNKRTGTDNEKSSGVGLFICKDLIEQNMGSIEVMDNPNGKGTIFNFSLKRAAS